MLPYTRRWRQPLQFQGSLELLEEMILIILLLVAGAQSSPAISRNSGAIFSTQLRENSWIDMLRNPCMHESPETRQSLSMASHDQILSVRGREREIRSIAGNLLRRMKSIPNTGNQECSVSIPSLPTLTSLNSSSSVLDLTKLEELYESALYLSAHFKYMADDWQHGSHCFNENINQRLVNAFTRQSENFEHIMCRLMAPVDPPSVPYPSDEMHTMYLTSLETQIFHYHDCIGRAERDCQVLTHAKTFLEQLFQLVSNSLN